VNSKSRYRIGNQISLWGIIISSTLVLIILTSYIYDKVTSFKYASPNIDLIWVLDSKEIGKICIDQKEIFKIDSTNCLNQIKNNFTIGNHEIIIYDEFGKILAKDTVFIDVYNRYNLSIFEIPDGNNKKIKIELIEVFHD